MAYAIVQTLRIHAAHRGKITSVAVGSRNFACGFGTHTARIRLPDFNLCAGERLAVWRAEYAA